MKQVSRFNGRKGLQAHILKLQHREPMQQRTTDSDTVLLDGTQYYYKVSATNSAGDSRLLE